MKWTRERVRYVTIRTIGNFLLLFSLWGMAMTFGPAFYLEIIYRSNLARNVKYEVAPIQATSIDDPRLRQGYGGQVGDLGNQPDRITPSPMPTPTIEVRQTFFGQLTGGDRVELLASVSTEFGIVIPKIGANAPIFPNVDAGNEKEYLSALKKGVAHAIGTVFPGEQGNIYLFAHSTDSFWNVGRYNAIFYLIKELDRGDEIDVFFLGKRHIYRVVDTLIVNSDEVKYINEITPYEQLILQTCWPPGTTLKRLLVIARPEREIPKGQSL